MSTLQQRYDRAVADCDWSWGYYAEASQRYEEGDGDLHESRAAYRNNYARKSALWHELCRERKAAVV